MLLPLVASDAPATPAPTSTIRSIPFTGTILGLAPDATWLLGTRGDALCSIAVADFHETCRPMPDIVPLIDPRSIAFAPDSSAVAFSLDATRWLLDSDIIVANREMSAIRAITNEPNATTIAAPFHPALTLNVDQFPLWSADSSTIDFARVTWSGEMFESPGIVRTTPDGAESRTIVTFPDTAPFAINGRMQRLPDDSMLFIHTGALWLLDKNGTLSRVATVPPDTTLIAATPTMAMLQQPGASRPLFGIDLGDGSLIDWSTRYPDIEWSTVIAGPTPMPDSHDLLIQQVIGGRITIARLSPDGSVTTVAQLPQVLTAQSLSSPLIATACGTLLIRIGQSPILIGVRP